MQETRRHILDILRERQEATVDDIVAELRKRRGTKITAVTVRHHLGVLQDEGLIGTPQARRRDTPGRPQYTYSLTDKASSRFPSNYRSLAASLLNQMKRELSTDHVNVILEGVADSMAADACVDGQTVTERLESVVRYLLEHGYEATFEKAEGGYILHTTNCPYHDLPEKDETLCHMDMRLIASMLGVVPRLLSRISEGGSSCSYFIPEKSLKEKLSVEE